MQMKINVKEMSKSNYFGLTQFRLENDIRSPEIEIIWVRLEAVAMRLALFVAPNNYCWGMQFNHKKNLSDWVEAKIVNTETAIGLNRIFTELELTPSAISESLAGCSYYGENYDLMIGENQPEFPRELVRVIILPDNDVAFNDFLNRVEEHINQLGTFFILREPKGKALDEYNQGIKSNTSLDLLFETDHSAGNSDSTLFQRKKNALINAISGISSATAQLWLTSYFLDNDMIRPSYPLPETIKKSKRTGFFLSTLGLRPQEDAHEEVKAITLLRVQLMRKWHWPVGIRLLAQIYNSDEQKEVRLRGQAAWQPLETEVHELLNEMKVIAPILFD